MIIVLKPGSSDADIDDVSRRVRGMGFKTHLSRGEVRTIVGVVGDDRAKEQLLALQSLDCVESVVRILQPFKLASREAHPDATQFKVHGVPVGGTQLVVMAGPCSVESRPQLMAVAEGVKAGGAQILRGGAFKPRTSPYAFQGLEEEGLKLLQRGEQGDRPARRHRGHGARQGGRGRRSTPTSSRSARATCRTSRSSSASRSAASPCCSSAACRPRSRSGCSRAEYVLAGGNPNVILCERGIRTFETSTRNTLDLNAIPVVKKLSHLPVLVDPSHGTGHWEYVSAMAKAGLAAGADGLIIEVHNNPAEALSDGPQSLKPDRFARLMAELRPLAEVLGRSL